MCFQRQLSDAFMELGEMDQALDDVIGLLHETEAELLHYDCESGDANYCEVFVAKVQVLNSSPLDHLHLLLECLLYFVAHRFSLLVHIVHNFIVKLLSF